MITLIPKRKFKYPIDGKNITPDIFAGKSVKEIKALIMWEGNRERSLGDRRPAPGGAGPPDPRRAQVKRWAWLAPILVLSGCGGGKPVPAELLTSIQSELFKVSQSDLYPKYINAGSS